MKNSIIILIAFSQIFFGCNKIDAEDFKQLVADCQIQAENRFKPRDPNIRLEEREWYTIYDAIETRIRLCMQSKGYRFNAFSRANCKHIYPIAWAGHTLKECYDY